MNMLHAGQASQLGGAAMMGQAYAAETPREERVSEAMARTASEALKRLVATVDTVDGLRSRLLGLSEPQAAGKDNRVEPVRCELAQIQHLLDTIEAVSVQLGQKIGDLQRI